MKGFMLYAIDNKLCVPVHSKASLVSFCIAYNGSGTRCKIDVIMERSIGQMR
jgi:hypothetical protein